MLIVNDVVDRLQQGATISTLLREQQSYHEYRRWSTDALFGRRHLRQPTPADRAALWHASRAELTTQPAGIRLAVDGVRLANELRESNPLGSKVLHVAAAWSARYWLEEEAHHEVAYGRLMEMAGVVPIDTDEVIDHRGPFPTDNYARVCVLQACVEIEACVAYAEQARRTDDELVRDVFHRVMRDEVQHRQYFVSFAKALVDAGVYPVKDVLSMAYTWVRPKGGETYGSSRAEQSRREGFVNWWEGLRTGEEDEFGLADDWVHQARLHSRKLSSVFALVRDAVGIRVESVDELKRAYFASLRTNDVDRIRLAVDRRTAPETELVR